jgi:hypothetical protein
MVGPHSGKGEAMTSLNKEDGAIENKEVPRCSHCKSVSPIVNK